MRIQFCEQSVVYLVAERASGVVYSAQAAGLACDHPTVEGAVVAVAVEGSAERLADAMCDIGCVRAHWNDANLAVANTILEGLQFECFTEIVGLRLDPDRLHESVEGWWWVTFELRGPLDGETTAARGVLCGPNCD